MTTKRVIVGVGSTVIFGYSGMVEFNNRTRKVADKEFKVGTAGKDS
jgi:hypothetical protein